MDSINPNTEILQQILDRDIGNIYMYLRDSIIEKIPKQFQFIVKNYIKSNETKWIDVINEKIEMIVAMSFPTTETSLEEGMENAQIMINDFINNWLVENVGLPENFFHIATNLLFGL